MFFFLKKKKITTSRLTYVQYGKNSIQTIRNSQLSFSNYECPEESNSNEIEKYESIRYDTTVYNYRCNQASSCYFYY